MAVAVLLLVDCDWIVGFARALVRQTLGATATTGTVAFKQAWGFKLFLTARAKKDSQVRSGAKRNFDGCKDRAAPWYSLVISWMPRKL